jgi:aryl-alcohol dehydrogenase-like predicted oxidoreductase
VSEDPRRPATRLALGAAQLGQRYGIANSAGPPDDAQALALLKLARELEICHVDTAQAYGRSEELIGSFLAQDPDGDGWGMRVITKLHPDAAAAAPDEIARLLEGSLSRLALERVWGLLLHREQLLEGWRGPLGGALRGWREQGHVSRLGVSVASAHGMAQAIELPELELIQAPANVFDRRLYRAGLFEQARAAGKQVFVRSVFLQGLVTLSPDDAARRLPMSARAVETLDAFCKSHGIGRRQFAVGYARHRAPDAVLVIGCETTDQLLENHAFSLEPACTAELCEAWDREWPADDPALVDPSRWVDVRVA